MKQITLAGKLICLLLICLAGTGTFAQSQFNPIITGGSTSGNGRAPQGSRAVSRSVFLVTAEEMTTGGFVSGNQISGLGFSYSTAQSAATTGTIKIYLENTTAATNDKSTDWSTIISTMTVVSDGATTVPATTGDYNIEFTNGTTFNYTGGNLFIAFDYQNLSNPVATSGNIALCSNAAVGGANGLLGVVSATGSTTVPTTLATSAFRPQIRLGIPVACARPTNLGATSSMPTSVNLTWEPTGGNNIQLEYGPQGFTLGLGTSVTGSTVSSPYTLSGLAPSTVYDFYVRTDCSGSFSNWNGPFTFNTQFSVSNIPYTTGFENVEFNYFGWKVERDPSGTIGNFWQTVNYGAGSAFVREGSFSARVGAGVTTAQANDWILSRGINLTAGQPVNIQFFVAAAQTNTTTNAAYILTVGTAQNVAAQTTTIRTSDGFANTDFQAKDHLFIPTTSGTHYFGIQNAIPTNTAGSVVLLVDNFSITTTTASTDGFDATAFSMYPNPASNQLFINSNGYQIDKVSIVDLNGRLVQEQTYKGISSAQLDLSSLAAGLYAVTVQSDQGSVTKKLVKK